jgi:hypothetical protein
VPRREEREEEDVQRLLLLPLMLRSHEWVLPVGSLLARVVPFGALVV